MSALTIPNTFTNNVSTVDAVTTNANNSAIVAAVNAIDRTNMGTAGIDATSLIPTTNAAATFGGVTAGVGYKFLASATTSVPLTVSGVTSQSVDIFTATLTSSGNKAFGITSAGVVYATGLAALSAPASVVGDIIAQRTASGGSLSLGGATHVGQFDYGVTTALMFTLTNGALNVGVGSGNGGATSVGDLSVARSTSVGFMALGGSVSAGSMDYNSSTVNQMTFFRFVSGSASAFLPVTGGAYTNSSDSKLKKDIASSHYGLDAIMALKPSAFTWLDDERKDLGFIAQDVRAVMPEIVSSSKMNDEEYLGIRYTGILTVLVKAFQDYVLAHP